VECLSPDRLRVRPACPPAVLQTTTDDSEQNNIGPLGGRASNKQVCWSLLSGRNVRWPRRMLPLVNPGEYADGTDRRTDVTPLHYAFRYGRGHRNLFVCHIIVHRVQIT